jgi:hypothetical protein
MVQICLGDAQNVAAFVREISVIAQSEHMMLVDLSESSKRDLEIIDPKSKAFDRNRPIIHLRMARRDGMGVSAGNLSLPANQVALGFSEGASPVEARRFATSVVNRLATRWRIETVPAGQGAQPLGNCGSPSAISPS